MNLRILAAVVLSIPTILRAEGTGFSEGRHIFTFSGGSAFLHAGEVVDKYQNSRSYPGFYTLTYGTQESRIMNGLFARARPEAALRSSLGDYRFEVALTDSFGLGGGIHNEKHVVTDAPLGSYDPAAAIGFFINLTSTEPMDPESYAYNVGMDTARLLLSGHSDSVAATTVDIHFAYHFLPRNKLDPYVRLTFGAGRCTVGSENDVLKISFRSEAALGLNVFAWDNFHVQFELSHVENRVHMVRKLRYVSAHLGFGFSK